MSKVRASREVHKRRALAVQGRASRSRVEQVMLTVGQWIVSSTYPSNSTLPTEQELCAELKVGRNAIREAIKMLAGKGFLRTERRAGTIILPQSKWRMLDEEVLAWILGTPAGRNTLLKHLTQLRRIIEPEVAALAAVNASTIEMLRILQAYEEMERHAHDRDAAIEADVGFHRELFEAAHNPLLASLSQSFAVLLRANFEFSIERKDGFIRNLDSHRLIAEAVHQRDSHTARSEMLRLLDNNDEDLRQLMLKRRPTRAGASSRPT